MLDATARLNLQQEYFPGLQERLFQPVQSALQSHLNADSLVLDAGCGPGTWVLDPHRPRVRAVVGTDVCLPGAVTRMENETQSTIGQRRQRFPFVLGSLSQVPFAADTFDLIVCYNVLEHLPEPGSVFSGFQRILKPGGLLVFKTPSLHAPLIALSRMVSFRLHRILKKGMTGANEDEVFPTYYRCNTPETLQRYLSSVGLQRRQLAMMDQTYEFLAFSKLAYICGLLCSRVIQSGPLRSLGTGIVGVYVKPAAGHVTVPEPAGEDCSFASSGNKASLPPDKREPPCDS